MFHRRLAATATLLAIAATASAQESPGWQIRTRGLLVAPIASSTPKALDVKANAVAEIDITRYLGKQFALELVLGTSSQEVTSTTGTTTTSLGMVSHLPPTLTFQFRPVASGNFQPYLGVGGNMTILASLLLEVAGGRRRPSGDAAIGQERDGSDWPRPWPDLPISDQAERVAAAFDRRDTTCHRHVSNAWGLQRDPSGVRRPESGTPDWRRACRWVPAGCLTNS